MCVCPPAADNLSSQEGRLMEQMNTCTRAAARSALPRPQGMEHRWGRRIRCHADVRISAGDLAGAGRLRDISLSGAFVETSLALPLFAPIAIAACRAADTNPELWACVVRRDRDGVGVEWIETQPGFVCPMLGCETCCAPPDSEA
jgi:hypothetical protein